MKTRNALVKHFAEFSTSSIQVSHFVKHKVSNTDDLICLFIQITVTNALQYILFSFTHFALYIFILLRFMNINMAQLALFS